MTAVFSDLGFSDQKLAVFGRPIYKSTLGLAAYIGFSDLNRVDENLAGTVQLLCDKIAKVSAFAVAK